MVIRSIEMAAAQRIKKPKTPAEEAQALIHSFFPGCLIQWTKAAWRVVEPGGRHRAWVHFRGDGTISDIDCRDHTLQQSLQAKANDWRLTYR